MRDPNEIFLKKIHNSFFGLSIAVAVLSTILVSIGFEWSDNCPWAFGWGCERLIESQMIKTLNTYIFTMILSAIFLTIGLIIYLIRRIIITKPSARIIEEIESRKYK